MMPLPPAINRLSPIEQIKEFNNLAIELHSGSITIEETVLQIKGGDSMTDLVGIIAFVIFMNWYDSLFGIETFQANPLPHQDSFDWLSGKYDRKPIIHYLSDKSSKFELKMACINENMCPAMSDENGFVINSPVDRLKIAIRFSSSLYILIDSTSRLVPSSNQILFGFSMISSTVSINPSMFASVLAVEVPPFFFIL